MTPVIFLYHEENEDLFAFFPFLSYHKDFLTSYSHVGQHSACSYEYAKECRLATKEEYLPLYNELVDQIGYDDLVFVDSF